MEGPVQSRRGRCLVLLALLLGSVAVPAARSDAEAAKKVSATTVAEGLKTIQRVSEDVAKQAGGNKAEAEKTLGVITPVWSMIEGTVQANDSDSYVAFEDAIDGLAAAAQAGDAKKAEQAAGALKTAAEAYVAKFSASSAPSRSASAAPAAKPKPDAAPAAAEPGERRAAAAEPGGTTLARTGPSEALLALAGAALGLGGLGVIGGARRRPSRTG